MSGTATRNPTLSEVIPQVIGNYLTSRLHTAIPGIVQSFDGVRASVQPAVSKRFDDGFILEKKPISGVPIIFPRSGKSVIRFPVEQGDSVLLIFCEVSIDKWLSDGEVSEPIDKRVFHESNAVAIPGLFAFNQTPVGGTYDNQEMEIINDEGKVVIKRSGDIELGGTSLKRLVNEEFQSTFNTHTHSYIVPSTGGSPGPTSGPTDATGLIPQELTDSQMTSKVKAE